MFLISIGVADLGFVFLTRIRRSIQSISSFSFDLFICNTSLTSLISVLSSISRLILSHLFSSICRDHHISSRNAHHFDCVILISFVISYVLLLSSIVSLFIFPVFSVLFLYSICSIYRRPSPLLLLFHLVFIFSPSRSLDLPLYLFPPIALPHSYYPFSYYSLPIYLFELHLQPHFRSPSHTFHYPPTHTYIPPLHPTSFTPPPPSLYTSIHPIPPSTPIYTHIYTHPPLSPSTPKYFSPTPSILPPLFPSSFLPSHPISSTTITNPPTVPRGRRLRPLSSCLPEGRSFRQETSMEPARGAFVIRTGRSSDLFLRE